MKKILCLLPLLASVLTAGTIVDCTPAQSTVIRDATAGAELFACAGATGAVRARLYLSGSFQDNSSLGPDLSALFTLTAPGFAPLSCTATGATIGDQTLGACVAVGDWVELAPAGLAAFPALVNGGAGSIPLPWNASASVRVESEVPEPASLVLAGLGILLILPRIARRS